MNVKLDDLRAKAAQTKQDVFTILTLQALEPHMTPAGTAVVLGMYPMPIQTVAEKLNLDRDVLDVWLADRRKKMKHPPIGR